MAGTNPQAVSRVLKRLGYAVRPSGMRHRALGVFVSKFHNAVTVEYANPIRRDARAGADEIAEALRGEGYTCERQDHWDDNYQAIHVTKPREEVNTMGIRDKALAKLDDWSTCKGCGHDSGRNDCYCTAKDCACYAEPRR